jgi:hypothetical protein
VAALGAARPADARLLARALSAIDRQLAHEAVVGTPCAVLGAACLRAVAALACRVQPPGAVDPGAAAAAAAAGLDPSLAAATAANEAAAALLHDARALMRRHARRGVGRHMRQAAHECLMQVGGLGLEARPRAMGPLRRAAPRRRRG